MTTGKTRHEFSYSVTGNATDVSTFNNNLDTSLTALGYLKDGKLFYKETSYTTSIESIRQEIFGEIETNYITGLKISITSNNNCNHWT